VDIDAIFGPTGLLSKRFESYEVRQGQLELVRAVDNALALGDHLLAEAGTGTGKSIGYSVPAILDAVEYDRQVIIVTSGIALSEQLIFKDLPMLQEVLPVEFTFGLLKGKGNFLCHEKAYDVTAKRLTGGREYHELTADLHDLDAVEFLLDWRYKTKTGDRTDLDFDPSEKVWRAFSSTGDECTGSKCDHYEKCFAVAAQDKARQSRVIVTNYHMLCMHLRHGGDPQEDGFILPRIDTLILDEMHEFADVARGLFGDDISFYAFKKAVDPLGRTHPSHHALLKNATLLFDALLAYKHGRGRSELRIRSSLLSTEPTIRTAWIGVLASGNTALGALKAASEGRGSGQLGLLPSERNLGRAEKTKQRCLVGYMRLKEILRVSELILNARHESAQEDLDGDEFGDPIRTVCFLEENDRGYITMCRRVIDVAAVLRPTLFKRVRTVIGMSATLTVDNDFSFIRSELGVPNEAEEIVCESPFDWQRQAMLIVPADLPDPKTEANEHADAVARAVREILDHAGGRTLALFTSHKMLNNTLGHKVFKNCPHRILKQGEMPKGRLAGAFKTDVGSSLFALKTFWQGIDIPGESLSVVVIDKLPFPHPGDPIIDVLTEDDPKGFFRVLVPRAIMAWRQGVGRLIRTMSDVGVIVVLDPRIETKNYGRMFIRSLPRMRRSDDLSEIRDFLPMATPPALPETETDPFGDAEPIDFSPYTSPDADIPF
jgi:ATP-dependent DNA helicase DinG